MKLAVLAAVLGVAAAALPGVVLNLAQSGLNYATSVGVQVLNNKVKGQHLPNVNGLVETADGLPSQFSLFSYSLTDLVINSFNAPSSGSSITTAAPSSIQLKAGKISGALSGKYEVKVGSGWFSVTKSGSITVTMAQLSPGSCSASAGNLDITFHGDLIDDIVNQFKGDISGYVAGKIRPIICSALTGLVRDQANQELGGIPTVVSLGGGYNLDYHLTSNPTVSSGLVSVGFLGKFFNGNNENAPGYPAAHALPTISGNNGRMLCAVLDPNELVGSAANAAMIAGLMHVTVDAAMLGQVGLPSTFLSCNCNNGTCVGTFIPQIQSACTGSGSTVSMQLRETAVPTVSVTTKGAFATLVGDLVVTGNVAGKTNVPLFTASVSVSVVIPAASLQFVGWSIKGEVDVTGATLTVKSSSVGPIDQAGLEQLWQIGLIAVVNGELKGLAQKGFTLPTVPYIDISKPSISFGAGDLVACGDITYTGPL